MVCMLLQILALSLSFHLHAQLINIYLLMSLKREIINVGIPERARSSCWMALLSEYIRILIKPVEINTGIHFGCVS